MDDDPSVVVEFGFSMQGRSRDALLAKADEVANGILSLIGGEPWMMLDDDWRRIHPDERLTIADDQGFVYVGQRRYHFQGPLVPSVTTAEHHGYKTQGSDNGFRD